jgi:hypothetical protein
MFRFTRRAPKCFSVRLAPWTSTPWLAPALPHQPGLLISSRVLWTSIWYFGNSEREPVSPLLQSDAPPNHCPSITRKVQTQTKLWTAQAQLDSPSPSQESSLFSFFLFSSLVRVTHASTLATASSRECLCTSRSERTSAELNSNSGT